MLYVPSQLCMPLHQLTCCLIPVSTTTMNQEVSTHTTPGSMAEIIMIDRGLAAVLAILEPRQRSPTTLHTYVAELERGVNNNEE